VEKTITVIGLGAGELEQLPLGIYRTLKNKENIFVRTMEHPVLNSLQGEGLSFTSFDELYESFGTFGEVYEAITDRLVQEAEKGPVTYAVPGHPLVAETTVQLLLQRERRNEINVVIEGGQSFLDAVFGALKFDPADGFQLLDGTNLKREDVQVRHHVVIAQVYDSMVASEVKLTLMEKLPDEYPVKIVTAAGTSEESITEVLLYELDRVTELSNLTVVYVPPVKNEEQLYKDFDKLREVIAALRGPGGCPWDKEQTHLSLKKYLVEETYEVLDAIDEGDEEHLAEELGDVLLQVMLHSQIGEDEGMFSIDDVIEVLTEKMIRRHPHVFGETEAENSEKVLAQWEEIKQSEKEENGGEAKASSILDNIPNSLPSLMYAYKIQKKAAKVGFDWGEEAPMWMKLQEEIAEWIQEIKAGSPDKAAKEFGDILFVLVNLARFHGIDPEDALRQTNSKFNKRFRYIEKAVSDQGGRMEDQTLGALDSLWEEAKLLERRGAEEQ
jgi:tetrapyrrole methylase family protein/MazG family protein